MRKLSYCIWAIFQEEAKIRIVQNYSSDKGLTQLRRNQYYIVNFTTTNKKFVPVVQERDC